MLRALAHPVYRRLFAAQVVALAGTGLATVALGLLAYDLAGEKAGSVLGTALAIKMVAYVVVAPLAAALVARLPRRRVLIGSDLLRMAVALSLPFVGEIWQIYVLIFVLQAASATFTPTFQSVIPDVLTDEEDYTAALSLSRLAYDLESVLSPMLAAALLVVVSSSSLFFGTALGFVGSALLVLSVALPRRGAADGDDPPPEMPFGQRARHGVTLFVRTPELRPVLALNLAVAAAGAFVLVQTVVIARSTFAQGEDVVALLLAAVGAGSIGAAVLLPSLLRRVPERRVMLTGALLLTAATALIPLALARVHAAGRHPDHRRAVGGRRGGMVRHRDPRRADHPAIRPARGPARRVRGPVLAVPRLLVAHLPAGRLAREHRPGGRCDRPRRRRRGSDRDRRAVVAPP